MLTKPSHTWQHSDRQTQVTVKWRGKDMYVGEKGKKEGWTFPFFFLSLLGTP